MLSPQLLLQTHMDTLAKGSLAMCIIPHLADTPTSYVFSELLWVYMTVCGCCDWLGKRSKRSRHFFNQSEVKPKPMVFVDTCVQALGARYLNFHWVLIDSFDCLCILWLAREKIAPLFQLVRRRSSHLSKNSYFCHEAPTRMLIHVLPICKKRESQH